MDKTGTPEMMAISIKEFLAGGALPVDLYIRLAAGKFVLVAKAGSTTNLGELKVIKENQIQSLYVAKEEYERHVANKLSVAEAVITKMALPDAKKSEFLSKTAASVLNEIESLGFNQETFEHARDMSASTIAFVESRPDLSELLSGLSRTNDRLMAHAMAVSLFSTMIGKAMDWTMPGTLEKLSLAGLIHDVGLLAIPKELVHKPREQMSASEIAAYEAHTVKGAEILKRLPSLSADIVAAALEHHENAVGKGYPKKLRDMKINPFARVVSLADLFTDLTLKTENNPHPKTPGEAIMHIEHVMGLPFNRATFIGLKRMVQTSKQRNAA